MSAIVTFANPPQAAFGQFDSDDPYEPFVVVDIADLAGSQTALYGTVHGEATDVNDQLFACGWYEDDSQPANDHPFILHPRDGGFAEKLPLGSYDDGRALALTNAANYDMSNVTVVGWVDGGSGALAAYWTYNGFSWSLNTITFTGTYDESWATDISVDSDVIVGYHDDSGTYRPFEYDISAETETTYGSDYADAMGTNDDGSVFVGTDFDENPDNAFHYDGSSWSLLPDPTAYEDSFGKAVNDMDDVVGYAIDEDTTPDSYHGVLWFWSSGTSTWSPAVLSTNEPDPVDSALTAVTNQSDDAVDIVGTYWDTAGLPPPVPDGAFYVTLNTSGSYKSYSLDAVTSGQDQHPSLALYPLRIRREVAENSWTPVTHSANGINNRSTIAGSYDDGAPTSSKIRPCLYVANDVDNNGVPDIREILQARLDSRELDKNENWLLDWAENDSNNDDQHMRCGLHAPGVDGRDATSGTRMLLVDDVQIVRHPFKYESIETPASFPDDFGLLDFGTDDPSCTVCQNVYDRIVEWGTSDGTQHGEQQREIVITLRNQDGTETQYDYIPDDDYDSKIAALKDFAYRFAPCIDYIQMGNEAFTGDGPGSFLVDVGEGEVHISTLTGQDYSDGVQLVLDWCEEQAEAARQASALRGRPLRFIGPGFPGGNVRVGYGGTSGGGNLISDADRMAYTIEDTAKMTNSNRMYFDLHIHYEDVDWAIKTSAPLGAIPALVDDTSSAWAGDAPMAVVALEWGPKATQNWGNANDDEFQRYFFTGDGDPAAKWDPFIDGWESTQYGSSPGFDFPAILDSLYDNGFAAACYGPSIQSKKTELDVRWDVAALRVQHIRDDTFIDDDDYFTDLLFERYQGQYGAPWYSISPFAPHDDCSTCNECDEDIACPGCN